MKQVYRSIQLLAIFFTLLGACRDPFAFSPFEAIVHDNFKNTSEQNIRRLRQADTTGNRPFKVALISDTHYHFNNLADAIADINHRQDVSFIVVTGDITENGLLKEFEVFYEIMGHADIPYLTAIGNHDHLSNGAMIYEQMFGPRNYTFTFRNVKFVAWDNTVWESKREADFGWLREALETKTGDGPLNLVYDHIIPLSHIPPTDAQLAPERFRFHTMLKENGVTLSVHGHMHSFSIEDLYGDGIRYMTVGSPQMRNYAILSITSDSIAVEKIDY